MSVCPAVSAPDVRKGFQFSEFLDLKVQKRDVQGLKSVFHRVSNSLPIHPPITCHSFLSTHSLLGSVLRAKSPQPCLPVIST